MKPKINWDLVSSIKKSSSQYIMSSYPLRFFKLKSLLEKWIKDRMLVTFILGSLPTLVSPAHSLVKIAPCPGFQALWFHPFQNHLHFNAVTLYVLFVCFNCWISAKWQSRNTWAHLLSHPVFTGLPPLPYWNSSRPGECMNMTSQSSGLPQCVREKDSFSFWMLFSLHYFRFTAETEEWISFIEIAFPYSLVTISDLRYTCISKYNDPRNRLNWVKLNITEQRRRKTTWKLELSLKTKTVCLQRHTDSCRVDGDREANPEVPSTQTTWGPE